MAQKPDQDQTDFVNQPLLARDPGQTLNDELKKLSPDEPTRHRADVLTTEEVGRVPGEDIPPTPAERI